ncbi:Ctr copper transporter [Amniculicola lignicola CBS 123094]|uniref:Copper transport protein n=1 Tax=Amniculicola lignicola CBS 123094 TaxID=1392246 RepID=A0A6A5WSY7_9PLEO|nr:Ctr copper transporter [Amniculicola lignicola CBS 123094]
MAAMSSTFSTATTVTLWFTNWTTTTPATYFLTILFLFSLGLLNRFLGALKSQLERRWREKGHERPPSPKLRTQQQHGQSQSTAGAIRGHVRQWSKALALQPKQSPRLDTGQKEQETEPLSPAMLQTLDGNDEEHAEKTHVRPNKRLFVSSAPWSFQHDGVRAALEFIRALIGYILMLAVMTYNVGFLFAVTGSVLLGELIFGRYTQGSSGWQEGGCHE